MMDLIAAIHSHQCLPQPDGTVIVSVVEPVSPTLVCDLDGGGSRQAIAGDVLSPQPNGTLRVRPAGTAGPWEKAIVNGGVIAWAPIGAAGTAYILPFIQRIPNV